MRNLNSIAWLVLTFLPLIFARSEIGEKGADLIEKTCRQSKYYDLCVSSLRADPRSTGADLIGLTRIMLELTQTRANIVLVKVNKLLNQTTEPVMKECLSICNEVYGVGLDYMAKAIKNLDDKNFRMAGLDVSWARDDAETCEDSFAEGPQVRTSPLTNENNEVNHLGLIAAEIIDILCDGHCI